MREKYQPYVMDVKTGSALRGNLFFKNWKEIMNNIRRIKVL